MAETANRHVNVGEYAPNFELSSLLDRTIKLSNYRGKKVILFMWASW